MALFRLETWLFWRTCERGLEPNVPNSTQRAKLQQHINAGVQLMVTATLARTISTVKGLITTEGTGAQLNVGTNCATSFAAHNPIACSTAVVAVS